MAVQDVIGSERGVAQPYLLCVADSTYFISLNSAWERVLGWSEAELMSRPFADFIHPGDRERTLKEATHVIEAGYEVVDFVNRYRARGGTWRWLRWSGRTDGRAWIAVATDVTDQCGNAAVVPRSHEGLTAPALGSSDPAYLAAGDRTPTLPLDPAAPSPGPTSAIETVPATANARMLAPSAALASRRTAFGRLGARIAYLLTAGVLLAAAAGVIYLPLISESGQKPTPVWTGQEGPPQMLGPVDRGGPPARAPR